MDLFSSALVLHCIKQFWKIFYFWHNMISKRAKICHLFFKKGNHFAPKLFEIANSTILHKTLSKLEDLFHCWVNDAPLVCGPPPYSAYMQEVQKAYVRAYRATMLKNYTQPPYSCTFNGVWEVMVYRENHHFRFTYFYLIGNKLLKFFRIFLNLFNWYLFLS